MELKNFITTVLVEIAEGVKEAKTSLGEGGSQVCPLIPQHQQQQLGLKFDGTALMEQAFSASKPILSFNALYDVTDNDEQKGFLAWFRGTVLALRNPRAHKIIEDHPETALEYIAFISLQAKLVDKTTLLIT